MQLGHGVNYPFFLNIIRLVIVKIRANFAPPPPLKKRPYFRFLKHPGYKKCTRLRIRQLLGVMITASYRIGTNNKFHAKVPFVPQSKAYGTNMARNLVRIILIRL